MSEDFDTRRRELRELNLRASSGEDVLNTTLKLDSSLKKNTAFIKKVRTSINHDQYRTILKDITTLSLEKYLSEVITSVSEGLLKVNKHEDIAAAMEIVSGLHQRFTSQFTSYLLSNMLNSIMNPVRSSNFVEEDVKELNARISRQKNLIKLITEFAIIGIFETVSDADKDTLADIYVKRLSKLAGESVITVVLKDMLNFELKSGNSLAIAHTFLKRFQHIVCNDSNDLLPQAVRSNLVQISTIYTNAVFEILVQLNTKVVKLTKRNKKASIRLGKILEEHSEELEQATQLYNKFYTNAEFFSNTLNIPMPKISDENEEKDEAEDSVVEVVKTKSLNEDELGGVWESVAEKNFYTKIPILSDLLGDEIISSENIDGEKVNEFLVKLENLNEDNLEDLVVEFNKSNLNNRATKNRLLKFFTESANLTNLKFYTKFLKINEEPLADLILQLIEHLDSGFRAQIYHSRLSIRNIFFFVEFIKFRMIPSHVIFHKIRSLTINLASTNNIDILSVFYEQGGRFLLHDHEYGELMREMVELLRQKSKDSQLTINQKLAVKSMLIVVDPVVTKVNKIQENITVYTPKQKFVLNLFRCELNPKSVVMVINLIKKTSMVYDPELKQTLLECFAHPELLNYDYIPDLAVALKQASRKYRPLLTRTIDTLIEEIKRGLELNDYRLNRIRMSHIKYLAELYNLHLVNFKFLNDLLYKIICYGYPNNQPLPNSNLEIDMPDNFFRVQLCCLLLISIDSYPSSLKKAKQATIVRKRTIKKELLDMLFVFFQYYIHCKVKPVPVEIQFKIDDLFAKYSSIAEIEVLPTLRDAVMKLQQLIVAKKMNQTSADDYEDDDEDEDEEDEDDDDIDEDEDDDEDDYVEDEEEDLSDDEESENESEEDYEAELIRTKKLEIERERLKLKEEKKLTDELDKEIQRMVLESYDSSRNQPNVLSKHKLGLPSVSQVVSNEKSESNANKISFSLLTKKGKKSNVKQLNLPSDNKFAEILMKEKEDQKQYREKIMNSVLKMEP